MQHIIRWHSRCSRTLSSGFDLTRTHARTHAQARGPTGTRADGRRVRLCLKIFACVKRWEREREGQDRWNFSLFQTVSTLVCVRARTLASLSGQVMCNKCVINEWASLIQSNCSNCLVFILRWCEFYSTRQVWDEAVQPFVTSLQVSALHLFHFLVGVNSFERVLQLIMQNNGVAVWEVHVKCWMLCMLTVHQLIF